MNLVKLIEFLRSRLKTVVRVCFVVLALLILLDALFVSKAHAHTGPEHWPGFWSLFGFVGCVLIVILSKWYGHAGIMTREDYYESTDEDETEHTDV
ncbi:conserved exported hypothetical protein (nuo-associated) [Verrucomicrobia bacterium]|nr:conserved exported hypothetical protein (nuo-associated) [Verrucomicrobiota bacterium]